MADAVKPLSRWTADTRTAFLLALRHHGRVREAAAAIGRPVGSAYKQRERDPEFAARWREVVAEVQVARSEAREGGGDPASAPRVGRERLDGWTEPKRRRFLAMLAREGSVAEACRAVGLSTTSAYQHRRRSARFAADWERALAEQTMSPIEAAYARAVDGWLEPVVFQGQVVAHKRRYSDSALRLLLQRDEARAKRAEAVTAATTKRSTGPHFAKPEETDMVILRKLAGIEAQRNARARAAALEFAERMVREGKAP